MTTYGVTKQQWVNSIQPLDAFSNNKNSYCLNNLSVSKYTTRTNSQQGVQDKIR